ncbi:hypothetical protein CAPTEDRAFT_87958, partial [Capitella teleta]
GLTEIPQDIPPDFTTIDLSWNSITTIGPKAFSNYTKLLQLLLHRNRISQISSDAFEGLYKLSSL